jgi:glycosyltransferase involved in cell wall biosynthesis
VKREPGARLVLAGRDSPDRRTRSASTWGLLEATLSTPARARTDLLGEVPYEQVQERIRRAAVCVFPSYAEAQPLAWLEAMACGRPLVGYDQGWAREVVRPGVDGILVPEGDTGALADAVLGLLADPDRAAALGASARQRVEAEFDARIAAGRSLDWYRRLLA